MTRRFVLLEIIFDFSQFVNYVVYKLDKVCFVAEAMLYFKYDEHSA